jgi:hypothetical protein
VVLLRGAPLPEIRLGPEAVHVRGGGRSLAASWDDIEAVVAVKTGTVLLRARDVRRRAERFAWTTAGRRRRDATGIEFPAGQYAVSPALLFHLLRFYHQNPLARIELGTAASLQRARTARFSAP